MGNNGEQEFEVPYIPCVFSLIARSLKMGYLLYSTYPAFKRAVRIASPKLVFDKLTCVVLTGWANVVNRTYGTDKKLYIYLFLV